MEIKIYDVLGRIAQVIELSEQEPGQYTCPINTDKFAAGVYFIWLKAKGIEKRGRVVVLR